MDFHSSINVGSDYKDTVFYPVLGAEIDYKINMDTNIVVSGLASRWRVESFDIGLKLNYLMVKSKHVSLFIAPGVRYHREYRSEDLRSDFNSESNMALSLGLVANIG